jgi:hypothetical protein
MRLQHTKISNLQREAEKNAQHGRVKSHLNGGELKTDFARNTGNRFDILKRERKLVERLPGPENREPWAGKRKPKHLE